MFLPGESPLQAAQTGKFKDIVKMLKEKEDEELNLIAEVRNIKLSCYVMSCFRFIFCFLLSHCKMLLFRVLGSKERTIKQGRRRRRK